MEVNLNIENKDIGFIKEYLEGKAVPVELDEVVYQLALFKTQYARKSRVKIYDPGCEYKVGDLIYKEYAGKLPIGSKKYIEMDKGVVLRAVDVKSRFGLHEILLTYEGTSDFRRYTEYLERQKIELLLPHKQSRPCEKAEYLPEKEDPRTRQDPLVQRDFAKLRKKLSGSLHKESVIAFISDKVLLLENLKKIEPEVFDRIKEFLKENKKSETTEFLVENFVKVNSDDPEFESYCFALNYIMKNDYKIDFQQTNLEGWGRWNLISVIYYLKKNSLISEENPLLSTMTLKNKKNLGQRRRKFEDSLLNEEYNRYFLTQREVEAGAIRLRSGLYNFGESIEIEAVDLGTKKTYTTYYYSDANLLLGFKECFESIRALQGMILTLDQVESDKFHINIRITKKGTVAEKVICDPDKKAFRATEEKVASPVFLNKALFLESDIINKVHERIDEFRKIDTLNKLVHKIFLEFGIKEKNYEIHILRLYHILDLIYPVELRAVEDIMLSNSEFIPSEKNVGVFYLDSDAVVEIEEEELKRRRMLIEESKKRRERLRQQKLAEERELKEEIRQKREERRRKREDEMRLKEKRKQEKIVAMEKKKEKSKERRPAGPGTAPLVGEKAKDKRAPFKPGREFARPDTMMPVEPVSAKKEHVRKAKKKVEVERPTKVKKRIEKASSHEKVDLDEIKSEIKLEELKEKVLDQKEAEREAKKKKEIAYKDDGGFGGILASKLEEVVKKEDRDEKEKKPEK